MDAVEFLKEKVRMTNECYIGCLNCPLGKNNNGRELDCVNLENQYPETVAEIVEQWSREHPKKTRQSEFLKLFPDAKLDSNGISMIAPCHIEANLRDSEMCGKMTSCPECRKAYWGEEVE